MGILPLWSCKEPPPERCEWSACKRHKTSLRAPDRRFIGDHTPPTSRAQKALHSHYGHVAGTQHRPACVPRMAAAFRVAPKNVPLVSFRGTQRTLMLAPAKSEYRRIFIGYKLLKWRGLTMLRHLALQAFRLPLHKHLLVGAEWGVCGYAEVHVCRFGARVQRATITSCYKSNLQVFQIYSRLLRLFRTGAYHCLCFLLIGPSLPFGG
jgi:hypothetical protein